MHLKLAEKARANNLSSLPDNLRFKDLLRLQADCDSEDNIKEIETICKHIISH